ncbi:hypothetical protein SAY87_019727 [Trapa incisa]|uniref:Uncharacterized protein n=1 Tax=Trapa incisa TaxID=236973 RepID=A0AAN7K2B4_9MYRT|nr:hypothetical protein SAY87_019727 [Trapa incisa]
MTRRGSSCSCILLDYVERTRLRGTRPFRTSLIRQDTGRPFPRGRRQRRPRIRGNTAPPSPRRHIRGHYRHFGRTLSPRVSLPRSHPFSVLRRCTPPSFRQSLLAGDSEEPTCTPFREERRTFLPRVHTVGYPRQTRVSEGSGLVHFSDVSDISDYPGGEEIP